MQTKTKAYLFASVLIFLFSFGATQAAENEIGMMGWKFNPPEMTVVEGETVTWHNDDDTNHNIAFTDEFEGAPTMDKPQKVRKRKSFSLAFNKAGTYNYVCKIHLDYDMKGVIIVKESDK